MLRGGEGQWTLTVEMVGVGGGCGPWRGGLDRRGHTVCGRSCGGGGGLVVAAAKPSSVGPDRGSRGGSGVDEVCRCWRWLLLVLLLPVVLLVVGPDKGLALLVRPRIRLGPATLTLLFAIDC